MNRLVKTTYNNPVMRTGCSCTLEGALKAAILRVAHGDATHAVIHDHRFGETTRPAITLRTSRDGNGIQVKWYKPRWVILNDQGNVVYLDSRRPVRLQHNAPRRSRKDVARTAEGAVG